MSPELALVDADLAAELRERLLGAADAVPLPAFQPVLVEVVEPEAPLADPPVDIAPQSDEDDDLGSIADLIVGYQAPDAVLPSGEPEDVGHAVAAIPDDECEAGTTSYPSLPASVPGGVDPMEVVLREIRDRLTGQAPSRRTRVRRRFTVASGLAACAALAVVVADVYFDVVHVSGGLPL